jgi:predicted nucleic acid-binding protein
MYLIDSDVLIQAKNRHYGFDFCPAFWDWIDREYANGVVASVAAVRAELIAGGDQLSTWAQARKDMFLAPDAPVIVELQQASEWADANYAAPGPATFLAAADSYLVAHAAAHRHVVVTHELPANSPTKIKIPNACQALGVSCVNVFELLRSQGARFVL